MRLPMLILNLAFSAFAVPVQVGIVVRRDSDPLHNDRLEMLARRMALTLETSPHFEAHVAGENSKLIDPASMHLNSVAGSVLDRVFALEGPSEEALDRMRDELNEA